jgi:transcriptional regulator with XRE-family HTH domain
MPELNRIESTSQEVGRRLRSARTGAGLTLSHLAERTNLSEGFLSKLERGQASSSIANLIQITEVLGLGLHELFAHRAAPARTAVAVHREAISAMTEVKSTGYQWRHLAGGAPLDRLEVFHLIFPRRERMKTMVSHPGQEHCYVLSGEILFYVGEAKHRLRAGEGIFIDSELPHRAENAGKGEAHVLMVVSKAAEGPLPLDWWRLPTTRSLEKADETTRRQQGEKAP